MTPNELLAGGYRMGRKMVQLMCEDLAEDQFGHQPVPGANSAGWIVGHLAVVVRRTADKLGATDLPPLTEDFIGKFSMTRQPAGTQSELGSKTDLLALLDRCVEKLLAAILCLPADALDGPALGPNRFASNYGDAILFGAMHITMHCGQLSTIRRSLGMPPQV